MTRVYPDELMSLALPGGQTQAFHRLGQQGQRAWLALHGGPGSGAGPALWQGFDLQHCQVLAPDQRGSGGSRPAGSLRGQSLCSLIDDLERLRRSLGLASWSVMGGSWGATLALMYAARHPQAIDDLVLRGSFKGSRREVIRLLRRFWPCSCPALPTVWGARSGVHLRHLRPAQADRVLHQLSQLFRNGTVAPGVDRIARAWQAMEQDAALHGARKAWLGTTAVEERRELRRCWQAMRPALLQRRLQRPDLMPCRPSRRLWQKYRLQSHHLAHRCGLRPGDWNRALHVVAAHDIATRWIHGRQDAVCPFENSLTSQRRLSMLAPGGRSRLVPTLAGHLGHEPGNLRAIRAAVRHG
ncbi:MAG: Proline iminopeptidase [Pseudomonadota bacterium]|jgi:proline iminopeptidase